MCDQCALLLQPLDYEDDPVKELTITVENEISYFSCKVLERINTSLWKIETVGGITGASGVVTGGEPPRSSIYQLTVTVEDVNEPPVFDKPIQKVSVVENTQAGLILHTFTARDPDVSSATVIKYVEIKHVCFPREQRSTLVYQWKVCKCLTCIPDTLKEWTRQTGLQWTPALEK